MTADAAGGVWQYACDLSAALVPLGWEAVVVLTGPPPGPEQRASAPRRLLESGLSTDRPAATLAAGEALAALARDVGADVIQLNMPALGAAGGYDVPVVAVDHGGRATWWAAVERGPLPADLCWHRDMGRAGLTAAAAAVAPSAAHAADVRRAHDLVFTPRVVRNGRRRMELLGGFNPSGGAFTAGRLWDRAKNVGLLDRAAARTAAPFRAAGPLAGPDGSAGRYGDLICLGTLSDAAMAAEYARRPVFASAALFEPFGLAVLEAAQAGCPLVLSDIPSFRELWGGAATFVDADDAAGFGEAVDRLASDAFAHAAAGLAAVERAAAYTPERMAEGMAAIFEQVLAGADAASRR